MYDRVITDLGFSFQVGNINPVNLRGLKQASYVLRGLEQGWGRRKIAQSFDGDVQLVDMWSSFLIHNHWIEGVLCNDGSRKYLVTDKGADWLHRIDGVDAE